MVRHVILWKLKEMPAAEQETVKAWPGRSPV